MASESLVPAPPDRQLLHRAAAGDGEAFADIFRRYQHVVYRFARAMIGCPAAAEDIAQEAFVVVFRDLAKYDHTRATFTTYLYGIVRNLSRDRLRKERRFFPLDIISSRSAHATYLDDPSDAIEDAQLAGEVRRALETLPARYRELLILCDLHDLSYADAAVVVGLSTPAVRSRLHRGRQLLRKRLARISQPAVHRASLQKGALYEL